MTSKQWTKRTDWAMEQALFLLGRFNRPTTNKQMAKMLEERLTVVTAAMKRLNDSGKVVRRKVGRVYEYEAA